MLSYYQHTLANTFGNTETQNSITRCSQEEVMLSRIFLLLKTCPVGGVAPLIHFVYELSHP